VPIARRLWQQAQPNGTGETIGGDIRSPKEGEAVAVDGDTGSRPEIVPNRSEQHSVATVPDHSGYWKNVASNVTKSNYPPVTSFRQIDIADQAIWRSGRETRRRQFCAIPAVRDVKEDQTDSDSWAADHSTSRMALGGGRDLAHCFLRLANLDNGVFERLGRYESALSRQVVRILVLLKSTRVS
jgi:hypothetical protein